MGSSSSVSDKAMRFLTEENVVSRPVASHGRQARALEMLLEFSIVTTTELGAIPLLSTQSNPKEMNGSPDLGFSQRCKLCGPQRLRAQF
nr:hypothetical protein Iba_chr11eCG3660 [Ipomoea batatas]